MLSLRKWLRRRLRRYHPERVPGAETAVADERKFREYLLSLEHPQGQHKARLLAALGYSMDNREALHDVLLEELPFIPGRFTKVNLANPQAKTMKP